MPYSRRARAALVLSSDSLGAALLGAAVELTGFRAVFARDGETAAEAVRREKPKVVFLDAREPALRDAQVTGPALMTGARLVFFGSTTAIREVQLLASQMRASVVAIPDDLMRFPAILAAPTGRDQPSER